jgi:protein-disulfide isomerase
MMQSEPVRRSSARRRLWPVLAVLLGLIVAAACVAPGEQAPGGTVPAPTTAADAAEEAGAAPTAAPAEEPAAQNQAAETAPDPAAAELLSPALPSDASYKGLPVGFTEDGLPYRGDPNAPIVIIEYSDFACPFCNRYFIQTEPALDEAYVREGHVRVVFHDLPLVELHPNAPAAHVAALCVADQGAELYWNMHAELFRSVEEWEASADPNTIFARLAEEAGADIDLYNACIADGSKAALVDERVATAQNRGFNGTPTFQFVRAADGGVFELVGAQPYDQFSGMLDTLLAGETPQTAQQPEQPEPGIPFWASADGWAPDPDRPGYNMAGDQYRGSLDAPLTVIEFSDFQCPYCRRHTLETQPTLDEAYVDSGKVLWVFKHFPLSIHPQAPAAGVAAECAAEQGQFWEMSHLLFGDVEGWSINDPNPGFIELAGQLALDVDAFTTCLDDPTMLERVTMDMDAGAPYVQGTPTFIILQGEQGSIIPGALPVDTFVSILDEALAGAGTGN